MIQSSWISWTLLSAVFLALYDIGKKASVRNNAVLPVLLFSTTFGALAFSFGLVTSGRFGVVRDANAVTVGLALAKSAIVAISWIFTFSALRTLPVTIATPIRASSPAIVFLIALFLYSEVPTVLQGLGMLMVFVGYLAFSWAGKAEGVDFLRNHAVWCAVGGAVFSAVSSLFDKYVFQIADVQTEAIQFFFQIGLVLVYAVIFALVHSLLLLSRNFSFGWQHRLSQAIGPLASGFGWRWTIPFVGILLAMADWLYFHGLDVPNAPVSVIALLRRFSVVITFVLGALFFHETNLKRKALALSAVLIGVMLIVI